ncbi:DNA-dependent metalloprotease WSS1-like protein [Forsythia ovata]|uniref:DNA-dependent metalloprotease WSS1-like protein n=1 Tax=Forsythia ovata TaxID=205694 RepID=A0ABD1RYP5_9LAMI
MFWRPISDINKEFIPRKAKYHYRRSNYNTTERIKKETMEDQEIHSISVIWQRERFIVDINPGATLKELGNKLQELTHVKADTLRLLVPTDASSKLLYPFSEEHSCLSLEAISVLKAKSIRMMGVSKEEVDEVLNNGKADLRIAGFDEEEKRLKQRKSDGHQTLLKLPQGSYIFSDFQTLNIPGIQLNPPASEALKLLHMLASDPGIVAIMNKHRWRVGILTEMAPVGYVGVSPICVLGVNKNHGEEISLRLRTDDLKGFRKYESIKKTLLHELAHMVYSEHDANFYALDKQLNKEAASLDWTKSRSHTLSRVGSLQHYEEELAINNNVSASQKLGGQAFILPDARASSVAAAYKRLAITSTSLLRSSESVQESINVSDAGDREGDEAMDIESFAELGESRISKKPDPYSSEMRGLEPTSETDTLNEPNPDDSKVCLLDKATDGSLGEEITTTQRDSNDIMVAQEGVSRRQTEEPDPDDLELQRIQDPVTIICGRLQNAIEILRREVDPSGGVMALKTLFKIICNVIEHPGEMKFKKLRKTNSTIQRNIINYKAAMDILAMIGFCEDVVDEFGKVETFLVLKRNDPGLLWLAKSSLEACIA